MPIQLLMPALSPTMTEGNLVKWLKSEGDTIKAGQVLAEIETDKATMEVEAVDEGTLGRIVVPAGSEGVKVNAVIAWILEEGEDASSIPTTSAAEAPAPTTDAAAPTPTPESAAQGVQSSSSTIPSTKPTQQTAAQSSGRIVASPLAKRLASDMGVDLQAIQGSGPGGRIVKADIAKASTSAARSPLSSPSAVPGQVYGASSYQEIPLNNMRRTIARRLTESKREVPHFYLTVDCELDALLKLRADVNTHWPDQKLSVNDFIIRAVALSLQKVPAANVSYHETTLHQYDASDVAVAVAIENGLITPVIRSAEKKGIRQLSSEMKDLAARAKAGKLKPEEYQGGSFTISNLGMYGVNQFAAILNPPQACILAVGAGEERPVVRDGQLAIATMMTVTLSVDHRAVDGALGAELLKAFKGLIEAPAALLI